MGAAWSEIWFLVTWLGPKLFQIKGFFVLRTHFFCTLNSLLSNSSCTVFGQHRVPSCCIKLCIHSFIHSWKVCQSKKHFTKCTLGQKNVWGGSFLLETRVIFKILTRPCYPRKFDWLKQNMHFFWKPRILNIFSQNFQWLVLGWEGSIDMSAIDFTQPMWSSGCLR